MTRCAARSEGEKGEGGGEGIDVGHLSVSVIETWTASNPSKKIAVNRGCFNDFDGDP